MFFLFHKQIHEISPGAIQKSNGLKVTCLMSLYFKFEEDTMKNEIPEIIFVIIFPDTPPPLLRLVAVEKAHDEGVGENRVFNLHQHIYHY